MDMDIESEEAAKVTTSHRLTKELLRPSILGGGAEKTAKETNHESMEEEYLKKIEEMRWNC